MAPDVFQLQSTAKLFRFCLKLFPRRIPFPLNKLCVRTALIVTPLPPPISTTLHPTDRPRGGGKRSRQERTSISPSPFFPLFHRPQATGALTGGTFVREEEEGGGRCLASVHVHVVVVQSVFCEELFPKLWCWEGGGAQSRPDLRSSSVDCSFPAFPLLPSGESRE